MDEILEVLSKDARLRPEEIAKLTGKSAADVKKAVKKYEDEGIIVKYHTIIDQDRVREANSFVRALIEVSVGPEKDVGFDHVAERIYSFPEVSSCYLVSGTYDLLVIVEGENIQAVSHFIAAKLSPMAQVRQTTTHFLLKKYKEDGHIFKKAKRPKRLTISY